MEENVWVSYKLILDKLFSMDGPLNKCDPHSQDFFGVFLFHFLFCFVSCLKHFCDENVHAVWYGILIDQYVLLLKQ